MITHRTPHTGRIKKIRAAALIAVLSLALAYIPALSQEEDEDVTKYTIREYLEANLPPQEGRKVMLDEISGLLTITDTPSNHQLALKLIREWDIGPKQIEIEAKFIEITFTDLDEMGVDWNLVKAEHPVLSVDSNLMGTAAATAAATFTEAANTAGMGFLVGKAVMTGSELFSYIKALNESGKVNLLNAPRITTLSGQQANIQVVRSFPYATSAETTIVEYGTYTSGDYVYTNTFPVSTYEVEEDIVGVTLEVTPTVVENSDIITLDIHPEVTKLSQQVPLNSSETFPEDLGWPIIDTRTAQTSAMVRSGETIIMGGLIQDRDQNTVERKVPFLGDIPLIGGLFRYKYENREKKNLIILLTARLITPQGEEVLQ